MNSHAYLQAVVTGGTSGIGRAVAIKLRDSGYRVLATGAFDHELERCQNDPLMTGIDLDQLDVGNEKAVADFFQPFDQLAALVNCAGIGRGDQEFSPAGFSHTIDINLNGTMRCCYSAKAALARQPAGSAIVNIASVMSFFGSGTGPGYAASKGAVVQLTKSLAIAWAREGIRVNAVAPGWIETPMTTQMQADEARNQKVLARTPMGRWGRAEEIASAICFLLSGEASFINGAVLPVDGGYLVTGI